MVEFAPANVRCEIPDDWTIQQQKGDMFLAVSPYGTRKFMMTYFYAPANVELDDPVFNDQVTAGIQSVPGSKITDSGFVLMHDVRFLYFDIQNTAGSGVHNQHTLYFLGNNHSYGFSIDKDDDDPMKDDELVGILESCNFINAPRPHTGILTFWDVFQPLDAEKYSLTGRIGYAAYYSFEVIIIILVPLALLLGLTVLFYRWLFHGSLRGKKREAV